MNFFNWLIGRRQQQQPINESASETAFNARMNSNPQLKDCFDNCPDVSEDFVEAIRCQEDCNNQYDYETVRNRNEAATKIQQLNQNLYLEKDHLLINLLKILFLILSKPSLNH